MIAMSIIFWSALPSLLLLLFASGSVEPARAENWPAWRGPRGDGSSLETNLPDHWNGPRGENIAWKVGIPAKGHASPIVWEDRIFLVGCREESEDRLLLCLDRASGRILWERVVLHAPLERKNTLNSYASSTPATDGKLVYVTFFQSDPKAPVNTAGAKYANQPASPGWLVVAAYDFEGNRRWLVRPGAFNSPHGFCCPPLLFEDLVILNGDHDGDSYLVALNRATGETVWKTPRKNRIRSYCPPLIREIDGRTQMVLSGAGCVASYDPRSGKQHWVIDGPTEQYVASLVYNGKLLFMSAGFPTFHILAIRPDGEGNVTKTHVVWQTTKGSAYVPSPVIAGDGKYLLVVADGGMGSCFEAQTGERYWMERLGPHFSASPVEADGRVYFLSDQGVTTIVRPGPKFAALSRNDLGEECYASPAISQGRIFIRGETHLYCIGGGR
jgi:outer membrane protein assembly factor BamB